jgi:L-ascorbate metabolism protein UlaG (beta-lactamase superfamily)
MSVAEVEQALLANPPSTDNSWARALIARSMDKLVHITVKENITDAEVADLAPLRDFYLRQVDRGLDELEKCKVTEGVRIFKFYSSSVIIKSKDGTVAFDFQQGPHVTFCGNVDRPDPVAQRTGFHWTPQQLERLAKIVDVSLITHAHADHADYDLTKLLLAKGKTVVLTQQLRDLWSNLSGNLVVPTYGTVQKFGPVEIFTAVGSQYMQNDKITTDEKGEATGYPSTDPKIQDAVTTIYLARIGGLVFLHGAENNVPVDQWLRDGIAKGFRPDVKMSIGARQGARSVADVLKTMGPIFFLPVHEYEMGHPGGGNRTAGYYDGNRGQAIEKGMMMPLFWGENFSLDPASLSWRKSDMSATVDRS